jgi:PRTRC genetic system protein E
MFTEISNLLKEGEMLSLNIRKSGNELIVIVLPRVENVKDPAAEQLIPLNLRGTPEELDAGFIEAVKTPVTKSTALLTNMAEYEISAEKARQESKAEKDRQDAITKQVKDAEAFEKAGKFREALAAYTKALESDRKNVKIQLKVNALKLKVNGSQDIFSPVPTVPVVPESPSEEDEEDEEDFDRGDYPDDMREDELF